MLFGRATVIFMRNEVGPPGVAFAFGPQAVMQRWFYFIAPCLGASLAGLAFKAGVTRQSAAA